MKWECPFQNKGIILDTCILQYLDKKDLKEKVFFVLSKLIKENNILRMSDYSTYELFSGCYKEKESILLSIWKKYKRYVVNTKVLQYAAHFSTLYKEKVKNLTISEADKIIGATAFLTNSLIFTADFNDFPRPFFAEKYKFIIKYKHKNKKIPLIFYFLKPEIKIISYGLQHLP